MPLSLSPTTIPRCFEGAFTFNTTNTGATDYITINPDANTISVSLKALSTCVATIQYTIEPYASLASADWITWDLGSTTGGVTVADTTSGPISAIRVNVLTALAGNQVKVVVKTQGVL